MPEISSPSSPLHCAIGITAHNEEANIGRLLERVLAHDTPGVVLHEIFVVASGCTDHTVPIVKEYCGREPCLFTLQTTQEPLPLFTNSSSQCLTHNAVLNMVVVAL